MPARKPPESTGRRVRLHPDRVMGHGAAHVVTALARLHGQLNVRLSADVYARLHRYCAVTGERVGATVTAALVDFLRGRGW